MAPLPPLSSPSLSVRRKSRSESTTAAGNQAQPARRCILLAFAVTCSGIVCTYILKAGLLPGCLRGVEQQHLNTRMPAPWSARGLAGALALCTALPTRHRHLCMLLLLRFLVVRITADRTYPGERGCPRAVLPPRKHGGPPAATPRTPPSAPPQSSAVARPPVELGQLLRHVPLAGHVLQEGV